jgi:hypothetical protein
MSKGLVVEHEAVEDPEERGAVRPLARLEHRLEPTSPVAARSSPSRIPV